jgi:hypothetical protein
LKERKILAMLSNSDTPLVNRLYLEWHEVRVKAARAINADGKSRGKITEVVVFNYPPSSVRSPELLEQLKDACARQTRTRKHTSPTPV